MCFLLNLSHCVKSYGYFCQILALFMMPVHQIWSCHMTQDANFENFLFCHNSTFNTRKNHKISSGKALYFRSYQQKTSPGDRKHPPPVPLGLRGCLYGGRPARVLRLEHFAEISPPQKNPQHC